MKFYSQKLENVGKALKFVRDQGIKLVAIGPEGNVNNLHFVQLLIVTYLDIVEKRIKLILGLIWTIILRYQINKVEYSTPDASATTGMRLSSLIFSLPFLSCAESRFASMGKL